MSQCIKELSLDDRPREKLMQQGAAGLSNSELLAILIRTGTQKRSALRIAEELTASSGLYQNIACVHSVAELAKVKGLGPAKAATILAALELGKRIAAAGSQVKLKIESPQKVLRFYCQDCVTNNMKNFGVIIRQQKSGHKNGTSFRRICQ